VTAARQYLANMLDEHAEACDISDALVDWAREHKGMSYDDALEWAETNIHKYL